MTHRDAAELAQELRRADGSGYGAYKKFRGAWAFEHFDLDVLKVQSDPYAPPSRIALLLDGAETGIPADLVASAEHRVAVADFLVRDLAERLRSGPRELSIIGPGQEILPRTSVQVSEHGVEVRLSAQLPAAGRRIKGRAAAQLLTESLPDVVEASALRRGLDEEALRRHGSITWTSWTCAGACARTGW